jgi:hypothetical protein
VVVGDLKQTEAAVRALNLGEVTVIDAEGNPVKNGDAPARRGQASPVVPAAGRQPAVTRQAGSCPAGIRPATPDSGCSGRIPHALPGSAHARSAAFLLLLTVTACTWVPIEPAGKATRVLPAGRFRPAASPRARWWCP